MSVAVAHDRMALEDGIYVMRVARSCLQLKVCSSFAEVVAKAHTAIGLRDESDAGQR